MDQNKCNTCEFENDLCCECKDIAVIKKQQLTRVIITQQLDRIQLLGRVEQLLIELLQHEFLDSGFLSKHNSFWRHEDEKTCDKLWDIKAALNGIQDKVVECLNVIDLSKDYSNGI